MNRFLETGYLLEEAFSDRKYQIREMIGRGATCAVYLADYVDANGLKIECLLKEYNPISTEMHRADNGELLPADADAFQKGLVHFHNGYKKQIDIRRTSMDLKNSTSNIQSIFFANGTWYISMTVFEGLTYDKIQEVSLYELLKRMRAVAKVVGYYHKEGFLHLDIKPQNILAIPETSDLVMLFDFDSMIEMSQVSAMPLISYNNDWTANEQINGRYHEICRATDLLPIGKMIFWQLFKRMPSNKECRFSFQHSFSVTQNIFENVSPKVFPKLSNILRKTLCADVKRRFQTAEELIEELDEAICLADPKQPYIVSSVIPTGEFFVGRSSELNDIHSKLQMNNTLIVHGDGGIGKSELVRHYAEKYSKNYDTFIYATYKNSWISLINDDFSVHIANSPLSSTDDPITYYSQKINQMKELCDERTLFIVDNLDENEFEGAELQCWQDILSLPCKKIITTRKAEWSLPILKIGSIRNDSEKAEIFLHYCPVNTTEDMVAVQDIIKYVEGHTLCIELIAKQTKAGFITPALMLKKIENYGLAQSGQEKVTSHKDNISNKKTAFDHIVALFDITNLLEQEKYVLANISLFPPSGIDGGFFLEFCEIENFDAVNSLVENGWIHRSGNTLSVHPVIAEVSRSKLTVAQNINSMLENISELFDERDPFTYGFPFCSADVYMHIADILLKHRVASPAVADVLKYVACSTEASFRDFCWNKTIFKRILELDRQYEIDTSRYYSHLFLAISRIQFLSGIGKGAGNDEPIISQWLEEYKKYLLDAKKDLRDMFDRYAELGDLYALVEDERCVDIWREALLQYESSPSSNWNMQQIGEMYAKVGEYEKSIEITEGLLQDDSLDIEEKLDILDTLQENHEELGEYNKALSYWERKGMIYDQLGYDKSSDVYYIYLLDYITIKVDMADEDLSNINLLWIEDVLSAYDRIESARKQHWPFAINYCEQLARIVAAYALKNYYSQKILENLALTLLEKAKSILLAIDTLDAIPLIEKAIVSIAG